MNNFDTSSTGENIEFVCEYDYDLGQIYYDEFSIEAERINFGRDSHIFILGDTEASYYKKSTLRKWSKERIFDLCHRYDLLNWNNGLDDYTKPELIEEALSITNLKYYKAIAEDYSWHSFAEHIGHDYYVSRGYCQGDAVYIISLDDKLTDGKKQYIDNCLWDRPIYINATINDQYFEADDFLNDPFEWDRDDIIQKIKALPISDYARGWLINKLPEYPRG